MGKRIFISKNGNEYSTLEECLAANDKFFSEKIASDNQKSLVEHFKSEFLGEENIEDLSSSEQIACIDYKLKRLSFFSSSFEKEKNGEMVKHINDAINQYTSLKNILVSSSKMFESQNRFSPISNEVKTVINSFASKMKKKN